MNKAEPIRFFPQEFGISAMIRLVCPFYWTFKMQTQGGYISSDGPEEQRKLNFGEMKTNVQRITLVKCIESFLLELCQVQAVLSF